MAGIEITNKLTTKISDKKNNSVALLTPRHSSDLE